MGEHTGARTGASDLVRETIAPELAGIGLLVEDVTVVQAGRRRLVTVLLERDLSGLDPTDRTTPVPPLGMDDVAEASRLVDEALEASDVLGADPYVLEVSSAGVSRPLTEPRHFRRNVGRLVDLSLTSGTTLTGRITAAGQDDLDVLVGATKKNPEHTVTVPVSDIRKAKVQVEFTRHADEPETEDDLEEN